jgi:hypothetical protein
MANAAGSPFLEPPEEGALRDFGRPRRNVVRPAEEEREGNPFLAQPEEGALRDLGRPEPRRANNFVRGVNMGWNDGMDFAIGGHNMAQAHAQQQGSHLAGMANQVQNALSAEHDSRVAQMREQARMEHQKELLRMQMEAKRKEQEGEMIRQILASM